MPDDDAKPANESKKADKRKQTIIAGAGVAGVVLGYLVYRSSKKGGGGSSSGQPAGSGYTYPMVNAGTGQTSANESLTATSNQFASIKDLLTGQQAQLNRQQSYLDSIQMGVQGSWIGEQAIGQKLGIDVATPQADWQRGYATRTNPGTGWTVPGDSTPQGPNAPGTAPGSRGVAPPPPPVTTMPGPVGGLDFPELPQLPAGGVIHSRGPGSVGPSTMVPAVGSVGQLTANQLGPSIGPAHSSN